MVNNIVLSNMSAPLTKKNLASLEASNTLWQNTSTSYSLKSNNQKSFWKQKLFSKKSDFVKKCNAGVEKIKVKAATLTSSIINKYASNPPVEDEIKSYRYGQYNNIEWEVPTESIDLTDLSVQVLEEEKRYKFSAQLSNLKKNSNTRNLLKRKETYDKICFRSLLLRILH